MRGWVPLDLRTVYIQYGRVIYQNLRYCHTKCVPEPDFLFFKNFGSYRRSEVDLYKIRPQKLKGKIISDFTLKPHIFGILGTLSDGILLNFIIETPLDLIFGHFLGSTYSFLYL